MLFEYLPDKYARIILNYTVELNWIYRFQVGKKLFQVGCSLRTPNAVRALDHLMKYVAHDR